MQAEEDDGSGQRADQDTQHQHAVIDAVAALQVGNQHGHRDRGIVLEDDLRPEVAVPGIHKGNRHGRAVGGTHDGHEHTEEDADLAQAVQTSSLDNIIGEGPRRLAEQHDHERGRDGGQNKRRPAVNKAPVGHHLEQRDHDGYERQHHGQQQHAHQGVLGLVVVDLKAVTGDGADQQRDEGHQDGIAEGVCHGQPQILVGDQRLEVFHRVGAGDQFAAHDVNAGVGSAAQHVVQRKDRQETGQNQHGMGQNLFAFSHVCHLLSSELQTELLPL